MGIKCKLGLHEWDTWYTYRSTKTQETFCTHCRISKKRFMPPLDMQIEEVLKMDISREEINRKLDNLCDWYGYQKFTIAMLYVAKKNFRVPHREARYVTRERLIQHYMYNNIVSPFTNPIEYAKLRLKLTNNNEYGD